MKISLTNSFISLLFLFIFTGFTLAFPLPTIGMTISAASCSQTDVQAALNSVISLTAVVNIPAGTCRWTTQVSFIVPAGNVNLSIFGAGSLNTLGGGDATIIIDDFTNDNSILSIETGASNSFFRLAGITFQGGNNGGVANTKWNGMVAIGGNSQNTRVDHTRFNTTTYNTPQNGTGLVFYGSVLGVADHNILDGGVGGANNLVRAYQRNLYGDTSGEGDGAWANDTALGSSNFMFFENNTFNNGIANDCALGGRFIMRYNTFNNTGLQTHPTGVGRARGCRAWEIYSNTFNALNSNPQFNIYFLSAGTGVIWGNSAPTGYTNFITLHSMRKNNNTYTQTATPNGWGYCGTAFNGTGSAWDQNMNTLTGYACIDQPGQGKGDLISGVFPNAINMKTGTIAWPNQGLEPVYEWNNIWNQVPGYPTPSKVSAYETDVLVQNRDYYLETSSFSGSSGVGSDFFANRPSTCTTGVAYWATDQGEWNSNQAGADGQLYKCTATNTWSVYYTPYQYPHPLQGVIIPSDTTPPSIPTGLTVQ